MLARIIEIARWAMYGLVVYNSTYTSWWITLGFVLAFFHLEVSILAIAVLRRNVAKLEEFINLLKEKVATSGIQADFGFEFSSTPLTEEEEEHLKRAENGDLDGVESFLASRCTDKSVDFTTVPIPVKLLMTAKVLAVVKHSSQDKIESEWADVLEDTSENN